MRIVMFSEVVLLAACLPAAVSDAAETGVLLHRISSVGPNGAGHVAAQEALRELVRADADALLPILKAGDDANVLAMNWLRGAFESIADRTLKAGDTLPREELEAFVCNATHNPRVRRLAYEWLIKVDPTATDRLIPGMLDDPSAEFRRDAVARLIRAAVRFSEQGDNESARPIWEQALSGAVHTDQVDTIVAGLKQLGREVDLVRHFGLLIEWRLLGPFDNQDMGGFNVAYPPEHGLDFRATYDGQLGPVSWQSYRSEQQDGLFDIGELVFNHKGSVTYAATTFPSDREQDVEFRLATPNAWKLWLNGKLLFAHEEYHRGMMFDQYRVPGTLKASENVILFKVLQNEQEQDWAQAYRFKFRVTDLSGRAILPADGRRAQRPAVPPSATPEDL